MRLTPFGFLFALGLGCSTTIDGSSADGAPRRDVPPGVNPDGDDPFRPVDAGPILIDGSVDVPAWMIPDASVLDQRFAYLWVGSLFNQGSEGGYSSAEFRLTPRPEDPRCTQISAANWDIITCDDEATAVEDTHRRPFPTAGSITVRGGTEPVSLNPNSAGQYTAFYETGQVFTGPRRIEVRATGGPTIGAFVLMAEVPASLELIAPVITPGEPVAISTTGDFSLRWRPLMARSVSVSVGATGVLNGRRTSVRVLGEFAALAGAGVLPARAMRTLGALTGVTNVTFSGSPQNLLSLRVGAWPVQLNTSGRGFSTTGVLR